MTRASAAPAGGGAHGGGAPAAHVARIVVRGVADAAVGARVVERLPATLERALAAGGADEPQLRRLVERAVREAAR